LGQAPLEGPLGALFGAAQMEETSVFHKRGSQPNKILINFAKKSQIPTNFDFNLTPK
jgi:hypothetical protein